MRKVDDRREIFARAYCVDFNAMKAAYAAGYRGEEHHLRNMGHVMMNDPRVRQIMRRLQEKKFRELDLTKERVLRELMRCAFINLDNVMERLPNGGVRLDFTRVTFEESAAISSLAVDEYVTRDEAPREVRRVRVKFADKVRALELLCRHLKLLTDQVEVSGVDNLLEELVKRRARVKEGAPC